jgi:hypothetical protein
MPPLMHLDCRLERLRYGDVLESSNDQDHAGGNVERRDTEASKEAVGDDSNIIYLDASHMSHGVVQFQFVIDTQFAFGRVELSTSTM